MQEAMWQWVCLYCFSNLDRELSASDGVDTEQLRGWNCWPSRCGMVDGLGWTCLATCIPNSTAQQGHNTQPWGTGSHGCIIWQHTGLKTEFQVCHQLEYQTLLAVGTCTMGTGTLHDTWCDQWPTCRTKRYCKPSWLPYLSWCLARRLHSCTESHHQSVAPAVAITTNDGNVTNAREGRFWQPPHKTRVDTPDIAWDQILRVWDHLTVQ